MRKYKLFGVLSAMLVVCGAHAAVEAHITKDPTPDFKESFDRGNTPGLDGQGFIIGNEENQPRSNKVINGECIGLQSGTVLFWIKPLDWDKDSQRGNRLFFDARGTNGQIFVINCFTDNRGKNTLVVSLRQGGRDQYIRVPEVDWEKGEWHMVAVAYDADSFRVFIDGKRCAEAQAQTFQYPFARAFLGGDGAWTSGIFGKSVMDELQIFKTALADDAIMHLYMKYAKNFPAKNDFKLQVNHRKATADGQVMPGEYSFGATGFFDLQNQKFASIQSRYFISYDAENLYLAVVSPAADLSYSRTVRDSDLWEDDTVEYHLLMDNGKYFQFIINPAGVMFDACNEDRSWNGEGIVHQNRIQDGWWTLETVIPLRALGITCITPGSKWHINIGRAFQKERLWTAVSPCRSRFNDRNRFAQVSFADNKLTFDISRLGDINNNDLQFQCRIVSESSSTLDIKLNSPGQMFNFAWSRQISLEAGEPVVENAADALPERSILAIECHSQNFGNIYNNKIAYEKPEPLAYRYIYTDIDEKIMNIVCRRFADQSIKLRVTMCKRGTQERVWQKEVAAPEKLGESPVPFDISDLPSGYFDMYIQCVDNQGKILFSRLEYYFKPDGEPQWFTDRDTGLSDDTPAPWTPPVAASDSFACWGRTYKFGGNALLSSIITAGKELLASPICLVVNGCRDNNFQSRIVRNPGASAFYQLTGSAGTLQVKADIQADFDGFLKFDLELTPTGPVRSAVLEIPLLENMVDAFDNNQSFWVKTQLPASSNRIFNNLSDMPAFWIGNQHSGLMWGAKNLKGWYTRELGHSMEIVRQNGRYVVKLNLVDTLLPNNNPRKITFYLCATPVKPLNTRFKNMHQMRTYHSGVRYWVRMYETHQDQYLKPQALEIIQREKENYQEVFHYSTSHGASPVSPEWNYYGKLWCSPLPNLGDYSTDATNRHARDAQAVRDQHSYTYACLASESFFWFKLNGICHMIDHVGIDNLYTDISWPKVCSNFDHGCGWVDEFGRRQASFNVFETREYFRRVYNVLRSRKPDGVILQHMLGTHRTPAENFTDIFIFGEVYTNAVAPKESYYDIFQPVPLRIAYSYRSGEQVVAMIKEFSRALATLRPDRYRTWSVDQPEADRAMKHFLGYCLVHDIEPYPEYWLPAKAYVRSFQVYDAEDWVSDNYAASSFFPYWENFRNAPVRIASPVPEKMMLSSRQDGQRVLSTIINDTDQSVSVTLTFHGYQPDGCFNMFERTTEKYTVSGSSLRITLGPREAKLLCFE